MEVIDDRLPILIIEDFYADPDGVRAEALEAAYDTSIAYYPGRHAQIRNPASSVIIRHLCTILNALGDRTYSPASFQTDFSIVTTRPGDLLIDQAHPHIDPTPALGLVYLNPNYAVGTSFYENATTGLRCIISEEDMRQHAAFMAAEGKHDNLRGYDLSGSRHWRRYHSIEGRYNRMVFYPGNFFHAIDIVDIPEQLALEDARLTQRFVCGEAKERRAGTARDDGP